MVKLLTKLNFKPVEGFESKFKIPSAPIWFSVTSGVKPNDWSIRIRFTEELQIDNTVMAEIDFLVKDAAYLVVPGNKFKLFGGITQFDCTAEIIKEM